MKNTIGVLPAAGLGSRLRPFRYPKELLPILFMLDRQSGGARPMVAAEYSLAAMREAGIKRCIVVIHEGKSEILKCFGDGAELGMSLVYAVQSRPAGLPQAIHAAGDWLHGANVCLALPDTVFRPRGAIGMICEKRKRTDADLVLGVFPTSEPQHLGPVRMADDGRVIEVQDKPAATDLANTWGIAVWSPRFTNLLNQYVEAWAAEGSGGKEHPLGEVFEEAVRSDFRVDSVFFAGGDYLDVGKPEGIGSIILEKSLWWS
ncbi:MAG: sugar phosphate nucleotidyltransferase [Patescibacteria group bacterium]|nr:sugar phosphate nucleotidyltransferase [Patescibacteria group bacterium]